MLRLEMPDIHRQENCLICAKLGWKNRNGLLLNVLFRPIAKEYHQLWFFRTVTFSEVHKLIS